jgi:signal transduction histidine kinase
MWSFVLLLVLPAAAVAWLGVQLIDQERDLESRRLRERRGSAADRLVADIERAISATERRLGGAPADLPVLPNDDAVHVTIRGADVDAFPNSHLLYEPTWPAGQSEPTGEFAAGEALELGAQDLDGAVRAYQTLASSSVEGVRAGALVRLARTLKRLGRTREALGAYDELAQLPQTVVFGLPADLVGRRARPALLHELGRHDELRVAAQALETDLLNRRWLLDRGTFEAYAGQVEDWLGAAARPRADREALAAAVDWLWHERERRSLPPVGRQSLRLHDQNVTLLWQSAGDRLVALVAGPRFQQREWVDSLTPSLEERRLGVTLAEVDAEAAITAIGPADGSILHRSRTETGLPWAAVVTDRGDAKTGTGLAPRRQTLLAGLALLVVVVITGAYVMARSLTRELAVARLQSDFVSAVSHEFRTPLTSLHQFTALLNEEEDLPAAKRRTFYQAQARAAGRLTHLVESLLDFGRMEAGAHPYRKELLSAAPFVADVVRDFERDGVPGGFSLEYSADTGAGAVTADREALARALRNLLENAVKYSGTGRRVLIHVGECDGSVAISVRDDGLGIPADEQREVFDKFVRGSASRLHGIKGTGIGLAMVQHIVRAHGGRVTLQSAPGQGSTFTILLPALSNSPREESEFTSAAARASGGGRLCAEGATASHAVASAEAGGPRLKEAD